MRLRLYMLKAVSLGCLCYTILQPGSVFGQDEDAAGEKVRPAIVMSYLQQGTESASIKVVVRHREGKQIIYGEQIPVRLMKVLRDTALEITSGKTNADGELVLDVSDIRNRRDSLDSLVFMAEVLKNDRYLPADKILIVHPAGISMELIEEDSLKKIQVTLMKDSGRSSYPIVDTEVKLYVQRTFSLLPFGGSYTYTDETGTVAVPFPDDLPGDEVGNVEIVVKLLDHERYGTLEIRKTAGWGIPKVIDNTELKSELWSSRKNAPISLVVISCTIIIAIWGGLFYLIRQLFKVRKLGKKVN